MPSDITGTNVLDEDENGRRQFRFVEGPIFTNILLADEINRTPPKTQAALAASDARARGDGRPDDLHAARAVLHHRHAKSRSSRKGPIRSPKPSSIASCSTSRSTIPRAAEEEQILASTTRNEKPEVRKILSGRAILNLQALVGKVAVSEYIIKYVSRLVRSTRPKDEAAPKFVRELVDWGAGPRAGQFLIHGGKALAAMEGRFSVSIEDIRKVAVPVLRHRVSTNFQAQAEGLTTEDVIARLLKELPTPEIPKFS